MSHVHNDHLGRPEYATNGNQQTVWKAYNYAYGRSVTQDDIGGLNIGFPGQYYDAESGLWYNGFRDYDASIGRYVQSDPIGLVGGMNTYAYAGGNPISRIDLLGLTQCDIDSAYANAKKMNPDINFGKGAPIIDLPRSGNMGEAQIRGDGYIHLNKSYLDVLDRAGAYDLFDSIIHEGLHFTRPIELQGPPGWDHEYVTPESIRRSSEQFAEFESAWATDCGCGK